MNTEQVPTKQSGVSVPVAGNGVSVAENVAPVAGNGVSTVGNRRTGLNFRLCFFAALALVLVVGSMFAERLCPQDPYAQDLTNALAAPSTGHFLGTDRYGRDMLSRVIVGSRDSIFAALALVSVVTVSGTAAGTLSAWYGGWTEGLIMGAADLFLAFPGLVFALAAAAAMGGGLHNAILALAVVSWPKYARLARTQTLALKAAPYIRAARLSGCGTAQILLRHILPNILGPILIAAALDIGTMLMELAGLSFLGLGARPPAAEWGSMISDTRGLLQTCPWVTLSPGFAVFLSVMIFNLLGDALRDSLDPRQRVR